MATLIDLTYDESASDLNRTDRVADIIVDARPRLGLHANVSGIKYSNQFINALFRKATFLNARCVLLL